METICISIGKNDPVPDCSDVRILPVYALKGFSFSSAVPVEEEDRPRKTPYGLMINRLFREEELGEVSAMLERETAQQAEVLYFADPAVLSLAENFLRKKLIYRPETLLACSGDVSFWLDTGIRGVSLSPVITVQETEEILRKCQNCEVMIHGRQLLSVSARKLICAYQTAMHGSFDPRSDALYLEEETRSEKMPVKETADGTMIFSGRELECFEKIRAFQNAGAMQYMIAGEYMSPKDRETVIGIYADLFTGRDCTAAILEYRRSHPDCTEGFYAEKTIL
ncbi:MAG: U32 family peptidase [Solobacterium sp.]|nr:U32 family peptidase [Solobacterium sp.]